MMKFKNVGEFVAGAKFSALKVGKEESLLDLKNQCDFMGSDYAMFDDDSTRAELNWRVFTDCSKTTPENYLAIYFHDVQSYSLKGTKDSPQIEDKELDFVTFQKEWDEVEFHFKKGKIIKVSSTEIELVIYPLSEGPQDTQTPSPSEHSSENS